MGKEWKEYFTSACKCGNVLNINYLVRTRIIASLPCEIVLEAAVFLLMGGLDAYYVFAFGEVGE